MIGIFDSGVGGMTVARAIEQLLPRYPLLYLGDIARTPYGPKSSQTIIDYSIENTTFLLENGAKVVVIACNSASSVATDTLRKRFDIPIIEVISPAVAQAAHLTKNKRIGVIGTRATIKSTIYESLLQKRVEYVRVYSKACPILVPLVEEGWINKRETKMILRRYLHPLRNAQLDTLVLGCTHYPLLKHLIGPRVGKKVKLVDSSEETAKYLKNYLLQDQSVTEKISHTVAANRYYVTDKTETAQRVAEKIFGRPIELHQTRVDK